VTPTPTHVLGVDPGVKGALCLLNCNTRAIVVFDMPTSNGQVDPRALAAAIDAALFSAGAKPAEVHGAIENVNGRPRQAHVFAFGLSTGIVHGVLGAMGIRFSLVQPAQWKSACGLRRGVNETQASTKARARELAVKLWPEHAAEFYRVKDDGRAEAALIARYFANICIDNKKK